MVFGLYIYNFSVQFILSIGFPNQSYTAHRVEGLKRLLMLILNPPCDFLKLMGEIACDLRVKSHAISSRLFLILTPPIDILIAIKITSFDNKSSNILFVINLYFTLEKY